jgi:hypothetical protein
MQEQAILAALSSSSTATTSTTSGSTDGSTCPFIVALKFSFQSPSKLFIGTEYLACGDLHTHLQVYIYTYI